MISNPSVIHWERLRNSDRLIIHQIVGRAESKAIQMGVTIDRQSSLMDITAVHLKTPLRLAELLTTDDFNFTHDVFGIFKHIDRNTGELTDCFSPRFTAQVTK